MATTGFRIYLEIASGRRPARTIHNLASPIAVEQLHAAAERAGTDRRPARIHRIALRRPAANRAEITALIHDRHGQISAVTMALQRLAHQRWLIADVHHLKRGHHLTHPHTADRHPDLSPEAALAAGRFDLTLLHGAAATADHRAHTLTDPALDLPYVAGHLQ